MNAKAKKSTEAAPDTKIRCFPEIGPGEDPSGVWVTGVVTARKSRQIAMRNDPTKVRYMVGISLLSDGRLIQVDKWSDVRIPANCPELGETVSIRVELNVFTNKSGATKLSLQWGGNADDESF